METSAVAANRTHMFTSHSPRLFVCLPVIAGYKYNYNANCEAETEQLSCVVWAHTVGPKTLFLYHLDQIKVRHQSQWYTDLSATNWQLCLYRKMCIP